VLSRETLFRLGERRVRLNGEHLVNVENFEEIRQPAAEMSIRRLPKDGIGLLCNQLVQRHLLPAKLDRGGSLCVCANPQFGKRSAGRIFRAQKIRDEVVSAPVVMLNHTVQGQYALFSHRRLSPSCAGYLQVLPLPWRRSRPRGSEYLRPRKCATRPHFPKAAHGLP